MRIDNYALTMFQTCPAKYHLRMVQHWTSKGKSAALGFGGAIHEGLAAWYRTGGDLDAAFNAIHQGWPVDQPIDDWRTLTKCLEVMRDYAKEYPREPWHIVGAPDNPMIECSFTLDTGLFLFCQFCGPDPVESIVMPGHCLKCCRVLEPIEYGGIFDGLIEFQDLLYDMDHKSTSMMGKNYFAQFKPNNQLSGYTWAASKLAGRKVGGAYINAIGVYKSQATKFERQVTTRTDGEIAEWLRFVKATCDQIKITERSGVWPMHTPACTLYGLCEFHKVHTLFDEDSRERRLEQDYVQSVWDYEARD